MSGKFIEGIHSDIIYDGSYGYCCDLPEHGHFFLNIHKATYLVCEECRKIVCIGTGVFDDWWDETEEMWQARAEHIKDYDYIGAGFVVRGETSPKNC